MRVYLYVHIKVQVTLVLTQKWKKIHKIKQFNINVMFLKGSVELSILLN